MGTFDRSSIHMKIQLLSPDECMPPHSAKREEVVVSLANYFYNKGWGRGFPALLGYPWEGKIQLLSGSHRWAAAKMAGLEKVPVLVYPYETIDKAWGHSELWRELMKSGDQK